MDEGATLDWELRAQERARRALTWQRVKKRALVLVAVLAVVGLAGGAVWAFSSDSVGDRTRPHAARSSAVPPTIGTTLDLDCRSPLSSTDPLRLWIAGDSLAGSLGPELGEMTAATGVVAPTFDTRPSSGLASPEFFDWPEHADEELTRIDPEVVVFIIGANDSDVAHDRTVADDGEPAWRARYALLVEEMLGALTAEGAAVVWVGAPTLRDERKNEGVRQLNAVARDVVTAHSGTAYVDTFALFADEGGEYTPTLSGADGEPVRVRTSDGIHFTPAGGRRLAEQVFPILDDRCELREQADPAHPQPVRESPGSGGPTGEEPPGDDDGDGSDSNGGTAPPTSPPTQPPTTTPSTAPPTQPSLVPVPTIV